jgi:hypothetical protein
MHCEPDGFTMNRTLLIPDTPDVKAVKANAATAARAPDGPAVACLSNRLLPTGRVDNGREARACDAAFGERRHTESWRARFDLRSGDAFGRARQVLSTGQRVVSGRPVLDLVDHVLAVEVGEGHDASRLFTVGHGHLAHHRVSISDEPVHVEVPPASAGWVPRLYGDKVAPPDDAFP